MPNEKIWQTSKAKNSVQPLKTELLLIKQVCFFNIQTSASKMKNLLTKRKSLVCLIFHHSLPYIVNERKIEKTYEFCLYRCAESHCTGKCSWCFPTFLKSLNGNHMKSFTYIENGTGTKEFQKCLDIAGEIKDDVKLKQRSPFCGIYSYAKSIAPDNSTWQGVTSLFKIYSTGFSCNKLYHWKAEKKDLISYSIVWPLTLLNSTSTVFSSYLQEVKEHLHLCDRCLS